MGTSICALAIPCVADSVDEVAEKERRVRAAEADPHHLRTE